MTILHRKKMMNKNNEIVQPDQKQIVEFKSQYLQNFDPIDFLGEGGFGIVFEARNKLMDVNYAIKRITFPSRDESKGRVLREVKALAKLEHENIVKYFNAWVEEPPRGWQEEQDKMWSMLMSKSEYDTTSDSHSERKETIQYLYIQMELCQKNSLSKWLLQTKNRDQKDILRIFGQITKGVEFIHSKSLIHRDLKPSNIFFSLDNQIKIGDFGLVTEMINSDPETEYNDNQHTAQVGTQLYMSPEQIKGESYDSKVDIYSLGVILFELLNYFTTDSERIITLQELKECRMPDHFLKTFKGTPAIDFVINMLSPIAKDRKSASRIIGILIMNHGQFELHTGPGLVNYNNLFG